MCSRQRPTEGADSEDLDDLPESDPRPPLTEFPRASRAMVTHYVREHMPMASEQEVRSQVSEVMMADSLGRAIHQARALNNDTSTPWGTPCVRAKWPMQKAEYEPVPYNYDSGDGECICEAMAMHLITLMKAQHAMADVVAGGNGRLT